jgi:hypothetical protein
MKLRDGAGAVSKGSAHSNTGCALDQGSSSSAAGFASDTPTIYAQHGQMLIITLSQGVEFPFSYSRRFSQLAPPQPSDFIVKVVVQLIPTGEGDVRSVPTHFQHCKPSAQVQGREVLKDKRPKGRNRGNAKAQFKSHRQMMVHNDTYWSCNLKYRFHDRRRHAAKAAKGPSSVSFDMDVHECRLSRGYDTAGRFRATKPSFTNGQVYVQAEVLLR